MTKRKTAVGFALAITLTLLALLAIIVVAYLASTRTERSTASVYANRLRAQITAESGLAAAIHVLHDNTRYGNYITAMPAASPSPAPLYAEVYRPTDPSDPSRAAKPDDYLRLDNAAGEILVSRAVPPVPSNSRGPDPRPTPEIVASPSPWPSASPFALSSPNPSLAEEKLPPRVSPTPTGNSYNFNQVVRIGSNDNARLVQPSPTASPGPPAALGQWVNVRNNSGELVGRYAFFVEDESMKVNVAGNLSSSRTNDLTLPGPSPVPNQIEEIDRGAVLPMTSPTPNRILADTTLANIAATGGRLSSRSTLGLLTEWKNTFPDYAHMTTVFSKDDNTTARGWQRIDLNALINSAATNADKVAVANRIANWIRDAWTGPVPIGSLTTSQIFNNDRLRKQIAANIVDYVDGDNVPTDLNDIAPSPGASPVPVIGIEKIPYVGGIFVTYESSNHTAGSNTATIRVKLRFNFFNLYDAPLTLSDSVRRIEVQGLPVIAKNGGTVLDLSNQVFSVQASTLSAANGSGSFVIPAPLDGNVLAAAGSGTRSFDTTWLVPAGTSVTFNSGPSNPVFQNGVAGQTPLQIRIYGVDASNAEVRLDVTAAITTQNQTTGYRRGSGGSVGDFLVDQNSTTGPLDVSAVYLMDRSSPPNTEEYGDPRYRPALITDRWRMSDLTDNQTLSDRLDKMNSAASDYPNPRTSGVDWFDSYDDRPLAFLRNGALLNIGELGNVCFSEYPWRSGYLQHGERPVNTTDPTLVSEIRTRRTGAFDYILVDLFRAGGAVTRSGAVNINTQQAFLPTGNATAAMPLASLFVGIPAGTPTSQTLNQAGPATTPAAADRVSNGVNSLIASTTVAQSSGTGTNPMNYRVASVSNKRVPLPGEVPTADNNPPHPYFQNGELASTMSRLVSSSEASDTSSNTSKVVYSALRNNPTSTTSNVNYKKDYQVEQIFREVSSSITTRGNVFRVLYVGQAIKDINRNSTVDGQAEVAAEYLGEAFVERKAVFTTDPSNSDIVRTTDSTYKIIADRVVTE